MINFIRKLKGKIGKKQVIGFLIPYIVMLVIMNYGKFAQVINATNVKILDTQFGYSVETAFQTIAAFGENGRIAYFNNLLLDCIFPLTYVFFLVSLFSFFINKYIRKDGPWDYTLLFPILSMIFDWCENVAIMVMIKAYPQELIGWATFARVSTMIKTVFATMELITLAVIVVSAIYFIITGIIKKFSSIK